MVADRTLYSLAGDIEAAEARQDDVPTVLDGS